jgi:hypothetical protein
LVIAILVNLKQSMGRYRGAIRGPLIGLGSAVRRKDL